MDYYNLEFSTNDIFENTVPKTQSLPISPLEKNDEQTKELITKSQFIIVTSLISVIGILLLISFILSIVGFLHQPPVVFSTDTLQNLDNIAANVSIVDSAIQASGFKTQLGFSAIIGTVKADTLNTSSLLSQTLTSNKFQTTTLEASTLEINNLKTNSIELKSAPNSGIFNPTSIVYTNSNQTNTLQADSIVLLNGDANLNISSDNIIFHQSSGKIKELESIRFLASNLTQSTIGSPGVATLLLPAVGGSQFGNLTIPLADLKLGSSFRIIASGTFVNLAVTDRVATLCISNTEAKTGNQPSQIIIGVFNADGMFMLANTRGTWIYTTTFSISNIQNPASSAFEAFGNSIVRSNDACRLNVVANSNTNIDIQQGLQLAIWGSWDFDNAVLTLNQIYLEVL
jgi:uncharacterized protein YdeI (BOF family)